MLKIKVAFEVGKRSPISMSKAFDFKNSFSLACPSLRPLVFHFIFIQYHCFDRRPGKLSFTGQHGKKITCVELEQLQVKEDVASP